MNRTGNISVSIGRANRVITADTVNINENQAKSSGWLQRQNTVNGMPWRPNAGASFGDLPMTDGDGSLRGSPPEQSSPPGNDAELSAPVQLTLASVEDSRGTETADEDNVQPSTPAEAQLPLPVDVQESTDYVSVGRERRRGEQNEGPAEDPTAMSELKNMVPEANGAEGYADDEAPQFSFEDTELKQAPSCDRDGDDDGGQNTPRHATDMEPGTQSESPDLMMDGPGWPSTNSLPFPGDSQSLGSLCRSRSWHSIPVTESSAPILSSCEDRQAPSGEDPGPAGNEHDSVPPDDEDDRHSAAANHENVEGSPPERLPSSQGRRGEERGDTLHGGEARSSIPGQDSALASLQMDGGGEGGGGVRRSTEEDVFVFHHRKSLVQDDNCPEVVVVDVLPNLSVLDGGEKEGVFPGGCSQLVQLKWLGYFDFDLSLWKLAPRPPSSPEQTAALIKHMCGTLRDRDINCLRKVVKQLKVQHSVFLHGLAWEEGLVVYLGHSNPGKRESGMKPPAKGAVQSLLQQLVSDCGVDLLFQDPVPLDEEDTEDGRPPDLPEVLTHVSSTELCGPGQNPLSGKDAQGPFPAQPLPADTRLPDQRGSSVTENKASSLIHQAIEGIVKEVWTQLPTDIPHSHPGLTENQEQFKLQVMTIVESEARTLGRRVEELQKEVETSRSENTAMRQRLETAEQSRKEMTQSMHQMVTRLQEQDKAIEEMRRAARLSETQQKERETAEEETKQHMYTMEERMKQQMKVTEGAMKEQVNTMEESMKEQMKVMEERMKEQMKVMEERMKEQMKGMEAKLKVMEDRNRQLQQDQARSLAESEDREEQSREEQSREKQSREEQMSAQLNKLREEIQGMQQTLTLQKAQHGELHTTVTKHQRVFQHLTAAQPGMESALAETALEKEEEEEEEESLGAVGGVMPTRNVFSSALAESEETTSKLQGKDEERQSNQIEEKIHPMGTRAGSDAAQSLSDRQGVAAVPADREEGGEERPPRDDLSPEVVSSQGGARSKTSQKAVQSEAEASPPGSQTSGQSDTTAGGDSSQERPGNSDPYEETDDELLMRARNFLDWVEYPGDPQDSRATITRHVSTALRNEPEPAPRAKCLDTIVCVDVSDSIVSGGYLDTLKTTAMAFVDGIEDQMNEMDLEENVAVVAMGGHAHVIQHLTNDLTLVRDAIESLTPENCGGRSPFMQALMVCLAANKGRGGVLNIAGVYKVRPRIIFITDGCPTDEAVETGPDLPGNINQTKFSLVNLLSQLSSKKQKTIPRPISWVPIGHKADTVFMKSLADLAGGELVMPEDIQHLCRYYKMQQLTGRLLKMVKKLDEGVDQNSRIKDLLNAMCSDSITDDEKDQVVDSVKKLMKGPEEEEDPQADDFDNVYEDEGKVQSGTLLPLGARVVRGPDWKWKNQDTDSPGTVILHNKMDNWLYIRWDNGTHNAYRYKEGGKTDVVETHHHPRQIPPDSSRLDFGVRVVRGPDWKKDNNEDGQGPGTVIRCREEDGKVKVRWDNTRKIHEYKYSRTEGREVQVSLPEFPRHGQSGREANTAFMEQADDGKTIPMWMWRDEFRQWRLYKEAVATKLETEYQKRPGASCIITRAGKDRRVIFKQMQEKAVDGSIHTDVIREMVDEERRNDLLAIEMSLQDFV